MTTHPPGQPTGPTGPGRLPHMAEVVADADRLLAQAIAIIDREYDPASRPVDVGHAADFDYYRSAAAKHAADARLALAVLDELVRSEAPGPSPSSGAPAALPERGVGPGLIGPSPVRRGYPGGT